MCPFYIDFVPNPEVMNKLYRRMAMIKDPVTQLWGGYKVMVLEDDQINILVDRPTRFVDWCCDKDA